MLILLATDNEINSYTVSLTQIKTKFAMPFLDIDVGGLLISVEKVGLHGMKINKESTTVIIDISVYHCNQSSLMATRSQ